MKTTIGLLAAAVLGLTTPAAAQLSTTDTQSTVSSTPTTVTTQVVEWDITPLGSLVPGALSVDDKSDSHKGKVWFVTRVGDTELYRFTPGTDMKHDHASAISWQLDAQLTGGLRLRHSDDGRFVFVNVQSPGSAPSADALVAIDTQDNSRITWVDQPSADFSQSPSDVTVDTRDGGWNVYSAAPVYDPTDFPDAPDGVVQQLRPGQPQLVNGSWVVPAVVTRFPVGGGAGTCDDGSGSPASPCIPGIAADTRRGHPIFFSEPVFSLPDGSVTGAIGELDQRPVSCPFDATATCARVRHWPLPSTLGSPRQIRVDDMGRLWGITNNGSLFSLAIDLHDDQATLNEHAPIVIDPYLFAVAPKSGLVGFTQSNDSMVSVLIPERTNETVLATVEYVKPLTKTINGSRDTVLPVSHDIVPTAGTAQGTKYEKAGDGTYVQTDISTTTTNDGTMTDSMFPTGMDGDGTWRTGAFYYGIAFSGGTNRIGHLFVNIDKHQDMEYRRSDDDQDHDGIADENDDDVDGDGIPNTMDLDTDNDGVLDAADADKNGDGIEDAYESTGNVVSERKDSGTMAPGDTLEYETTFDSHSLLLTTIFQATDPTAQLTLQIVDDSGNVVLNLPAALGTAAASTVPPLPGVYTVRITNTGATSTTYTAKILTTQALY